MLFVLMKQVFVELILLLSLQDYFQLDLTQHHFFLRALVNFNLSKNLETEYER